VPAAMFLLGRVNWWCPRWLDRVLPRLEAEVPAGVTTREADTVRP
jgi:putative drug exporter of the RND superfamily